MKQHSASRSPNIICWRGYFYFILCFFALCQILSDHRDLGLFLGSLFCSIVYVSVLMPVPGCFDYSALVIQFDIRYLCPADADKLLSLCPPWSVYEVNWVRASCVPTSSFLVGLATALKVPVQCTLVPLL